MAKSSRGILNGLGQIQVPLLRVSPSASVASFTPPEILELICCGEFHAFEKLLEKDKDGIDLSVKKADDSSNVLHCLVFSST